MERNFSLIGLNWFCALMICCCQSAEAPKAPTFSKIDEVQLVKDDGATHSFNVDDSRVLTVNSKSDLYLWEFEDSAKLRLLATNKKNWSCWNYAYSRSNRLVAFPTENCNGLYFYKIQSDGSFEQVKFLDWSKRCKNGPTLEFGFSPNGAQFAYASYETRSIEVIDTNAYKPVLSISHKEYVDYLQFLENDLLLSITLDDKVRVWKLSSDGSTMVVDCVIPKDGWSIMNVSYDSKDKRLLIWYGMPGPYIGFSEIQVTKECSAEHHKMKQNTKDGILVLRMDPDMKYVVMGTMESELIIFDYKTCKEITRFTLKGAPASVLFRKNGDQFLVGCLNGYTSLFARRFGQ